MRQLVVGAIATMTLAGCGGSDGSASSTAAATTGSGANGAAVELVRDTVIGARFGTPGPRTCSTYRDPQAGPLTAEQARAYAICSVEGVSGSGEDVTLLSDVRLDRIQARPRTDDDAFDGIDYDKPVYNIRGSTIVWSCSAPGGTLPEDKLCSRREATDEEGRCYQKTDGEWRCSWTDLTSPMPSTDANQNVPRPESAD